MALWPMQTLAVKGLTALHRRRRAKGLTALRRRATSAENARFQEQA